MKLNGSDIIVDLFSDMYTFRRGDDEAIFLDSDFDMLDFSNNFWTYLELLRTGTIDQMKEVAETDDEAESIAKGIRLTNRNVKIEFWFQEKKVFLTRVCSMFCEHTFDEILFPLESFNHFLDIAGFPRRSHLLPYLTLKWE